MRSHSIRDILHLPNLLSAARVPIAVAFPLASDSASQLAMLAAAGATDMLDGWSARRLGQATALGAAIDGFADKIFGTSVLVTLVARGMLSPASAFLLATRELVELPLAVHVLVNPRARAVARHRSANKLGKLATALQLGAIAAAVTRSRLTKPLAVAAGVVGVLAGVSYWKRELEAEREYDGPPSTRELPVPYLLAGGRAPVDHPRAA